MTQITSLAMLPDWRRVEMAEFAADSFAKTLDKRKYAIVEYRHGAPTRVVSFVSTAYRFVCPHDYFGDLMTLVSEHLQGDVAVLSVRTLSSKVFVSFKLPSKFHLTSDVKDSFGLTMVACNPFSGTEAHRIGVGAIREYCTNGCYFGEHKSVSYSHKRKHGSDADTATINNEQIVKVLDNAAPLAQKYVDRLVHRKCAKVPGDFKGLTAASLLGYAATPLEQIVLAVPGLSVKQRLKVYEQVRLSMDAASVASDVFGVYDLWNAFTYVATRLSTSGGTHNMLDAINEAFEDGNVVDEIMDDRNAPKWSSRVEQARALMRAEWM